MGVGGGLFGAIMAVAFTLTMVFVLLTILIAIIDVNFISATGLGEAAGTEENLVRWLSKIPVPRYGVACTIRIVIFRGRNLAVGDPEFGTSDPYIKVNCTGPKSAGKRPHPDKRKTYQTKTKRGTLNPVWEEAIELDGDIDDDRIVLSLYDEDIISQDEFLGEAIIPLYLLEDDRTVHHVNMRVGDVHRCPESGAPLPAPIVPHHVLEETRERRHKLERTSSSSDDADDDSNSKGAAGKARGGAGSGSCAAAAAAGHGDANQNGGAANTAAARRRARSVDAQTAANVAARTLAGEMSSREAGSAARSVQARAATAKVATTCR